MRAQSLFALTLIVASSFALGFAPKADPDVEALLTKMRDAYKNAKSARFDVNIAIEGEDGDDEKLEASAKVLVASGNRARIEFTPKIEGESRTAYYIQDGKKMGLGEAPDKLKSVPFDEDDDESFPFPLNLETLSFWQWKKQLSTDEGANMHDSKLKIVEDVDWNGKKWLTLEETAEKSKVFVRYYIDPKTNLIWRCEVKDLETLKPQMDVAISNLETDVETKDDDFKVDTTTATVFK